MSVYKLSKDPGSSGIAPLAVGLSFQQELYGLADTVLMTRAIRMLEDNLGRYPIHRHIRCAAVRKPVEVFDDIALNSGLTSMRLDETELLLDGPGALVHAKGWKKTEYCSCQFSIWAESVDRADRLRDRLTQLAGHCLDRARMFTIDWHFMNRHGLGSTAFDEMPDPSILDEAYPYLGEPVSRFVERYLEARETVLVLQGPPGVGKTRLVRAILARLSERKSETAKIMYTADKRAMESDEIFVDFITGSHDAFVIEDADHLFMARSSGNQDLHRFLAIADGVVRAQGRKIVFTTNLPNLSDIDDALLRPGRCFASIRGRNLTQAEATRLMDRLGGNGREELDALFASGARSISVATTYQLAFTR